MKIQVKKQSGKKYLHKLGHDVSTTSSFGFCQPVLCREINAQDSVSVRFGQVLRLLPLSKPTFGAMTMRTYTSFVKTADIYHAFESFLSGQSYNGVGGSYIPTEIPWIANSDMTWLIRGFSHVNVYTFGSYQRYGTGIGSVDNVTLVDDADDIRDYINQLYTKVNSGVLSSVNDAVGLSVARYLPSASTYTFFTPSVTDLGFDSMDWYFHFNGKVPGTETGVNVLVCGKLNNYGRKLRKIWIGLGEQLNLNSTKINVIRLFAFYKAYFDLFQPQREITWKDTDAFSVMEYLEQHGITLSDYITSDLETAEKFTNFLVDLCNCYYTINPDYASAHIIGTSNEVASSAEPSVKFLDAHGVDDSVKTDSLGQPLIPNVSSENITPSSLKILERLTKIVNMHTAVGGKIKEYLRSLFNSEYVDTVDSQFIGSQILPVEAGDVFATAETDLGSLGEFAGKGLASTDGVKDTLKFTASAHGYLISFTCIVPDAKLCQAIDPTSFNIGRFDFFTPDFDGVTLVPSRKSSVFAAQEFNTLDSDLKNKINNGYDGGFGNIPVYTGYKIAHNILNGDMSLAATRASYLPFNVDKLMPFNQVETVYNNDGELTAFGLKMGVSPDALVAGTFWRYIGRSRWFGQFDRIFVESGSYNSDPDLYNEDDDLLGRNDDNFIVHIFVDLNITGYELPMSMSFDTGAFDGDTMSVEKS